MKKGFTLIELLAVIVILAIIALIAVPIVLSIISDSKESASLRSAEMYLKGVETSVATSTLNEKTIANGTYQITKEGDICLVKLINNKCEGEGNTLKVDVSGEIPVRGSVTVENGKVKDVTFSYSNKKTIIKNSEGNLVYAKTLNDICKYQNNGVAEKTAGALYSCEVKPGTSYNFYVLTTPKEGDTSINLIMDRNICEDGTLTEEGKTCFVKYNSSGDAKGEGPVTAITYLNNATSTWENIGNLNLKYDDEGGNFTGFELNGKARLPYKSEVSNYDSTNKTNAYLFDYLQQSGTIHPNSISGIWGYWILSSDPSSSDYAFRVSYDGFVYSLDVGNGSNRGVRPVITLKL